MDDLDLDGCRDRYDDTLMLTTHLPENVPDRDRVDEVTAALRADIERILPAVRAVIDACPDGTDRETVRWLLTRTATTFEEGNALAEGPRATDLRRAAHAEDLAHVSRALVAVIRSERVANPH